MSVQYSVPCSWLEDWNCYYHALPLIATYNTHPSSELQTSVAARVAARAENPQHSTFATYCINLPSTLCLLIERLIDKEQLAYM